MSKKQKAYDSMLATMNNWLTTATQASPYENDLDTQNNSIRSWMAKGDYKNPQDVNSFVDFAPLAHARTQQGYGYGGPSDSVAMGANPGAQMGAQRIRGNDAFNQAWGGMYEDNAANLRDRQSGIQATLANLYKNRMQTGLQGSAQMLQNVANRPKGFDLMKLFQSASSAAGPLLAAF